MAKNWSKNNIELCYRVTFKLSLDIICIKFIDFVFVLPFLKYYYVRPIVYIFLFTFLLFTQLWLQQFLTSLDSDHSLAAPQVLQDPTTRKLLTGALLPFQFTVLLPVHVVLAQVAVPVGLRVSRHHLLLLADLLVLHGGRLLLVFSH